MRRRGSGMCFRRRASCRDKKRHNQSAAEQAAEYACVHTHEPYEAYPCVYCGPTVWHIGHPSWWFALSRKEQKVYRERGRKVAA